jgi:transketolase N-terminal domain/subunit/transketolase C-terminal domain/subunit
MPVIDSFTKTIKRDYTVDEVRCKAEEIRVACLNDGDVPGLPHPGTPSLHLEIAAVLYFKFLRHDPAFPRWEERDRVYWSSQFSEFTIRAVLEAAGYAAPEAAAVSCCFENPLGIAAGNALQAKLDGKQNLVVCMMGDADQFSGAAWEAADFAHRYTLGNLIGIVVQNSGADGSEYYEPQKPCFLADKYASFGWEVLLSDGNDTAHFLETLESIPRDLRTPTIILADAPVQKQSIPGSFVFMQAGPAEPSGVCRGRVMRQKRLDLGTEIIASLKSVMESCPAVELISADTESARKLGGRHIRFLHGGTPGNAGDAAAGLALGGKRPFLLIDEAGAAGLMGMRICSSMCSGNSTVKIITLLDSGGTPSAGGTLRAHEDLRALYTLPGLHIELPCDVLQAGRALRAAAEQEGPGIIRCRWGSSACLTREASRYICGVADILRYRGVHGSFEEAFESTPGCEYKDERESFCLVAAGTVMSETLKAAYLLKEQYDIEVRVLNPHTVKPLDIGTLERAMDEIGVFILVEDHFTRGFGAIIAGELSMMRTFHSSLNMAIIELREEDFASDLAVELIIVKALEFLEHNEGRAR